MDDMTPDPYPPFSGVEPYGTIRSVAKERLARQDVGFRQVISQTSRREVNFIRRLGAVEQSGSPPCRRDDNAPRCLLDLHDILVLHAIVRVLQVESSMRRR